MLLGETRNHWEKKKTTKSGLYFPRSDSLGNYILQCIKIIHYRKMQLLFLQKYDLDKGV